MFEEISRARANDLILVLRCGHAIGGFCSGDCKHRENGACELSSFDVHCKSADVIESLLTEVDRLQTKVDQAHADLVKEFLSKFTDGDLAQQVLNLQAELQTVKAERDAIEPRYRLDPDTVCFACMNYKRISEVEDYRADDVIWGGACGISRPCENGEQWCRTEGSGENG